MQLELNLDNKSGLDLKLELMEQKLDAIKLSSDKVRRGVFARLGDMGNAYKTSLERIEELENEIGRMKYERGVKTEWLYKSGDYLFATAANG